MGLYMEPGVFSIKYVNKMYFNTPKITPFIINKNNHISY